MKIKQLFNVKKQIEFGKNTQGYKNYISIIPKSRRPKQYPRTPEFNKPISKRRFDGKCKTWRQAIHLFDNVDPNNRSSYQHVVQQFNKNRKTFNNTNSASNEISEINDIVSIDCNNNEQINNITFSIGSLTIQSTNE